MINRIIEFSIRNKFIVGLFTLAILAGGIYSMKTIHLGSVPDITNNQIQVMTFSPNLGTEDIEQFVTHPVELAMGNIPGVEEIWSISRFGLSVVTIVFEDRMGTYLPRQLVQERLVEVRENIPVRFGTPVMGPITTGLGEIYHYSIKTLPGYDSLYTMEELREIQDWIIRRQMTMVEGVIDVNALGGKIKQYEVILDPHQLRSYDVTISEVFTALESNNMNTGGAYIERNKMAHFIRGEGQIRSLEELNHIVVKNIDNLPITIGDVAQKVHFGHQTRYGAFTQDGEEAVGGMFLMLKGANPNAVIKNIKERLEEIQQSLPEGLVIETFYDASELIERTTHTVRNNLMEGALIVIFILVLLLGSLRGGIIIATTIPLSLLFAFILMRIFGVWANLMSLGAIDFGIIVDGAVIIIEGMVFQIQKRIKDGQTRFTSQDMDSMAYESGSKMMNSAFFGQVIILIVFIPILFLSGIEGKMFQPMAYTFGFAMLGAILLCLTYVPMMSALLMKPSENQTSFASRFNRFFEKISARVFKGIEWLYLPIIRGALRFKSIVFLIAIVLLSLAGYTFSRMGGEFIPQLDEGDIAMQGLFRPGSSLTESIEASKRIEKVLKENFPEIKTVVSRIGVGDIPIDPMPMDVSDIYVIMEQDRSKWTSAANKEELIQKIEDKLDEELTGINLSFSQPIELRFNELLTGVKEDIAIKLYGEDLDILSKKSQEIAQLIQPIPGVGDVNAERISGLPQISVRYNRNKIAQHGLNIDKINTYINTAFAGGVAGEIFEGEKRFDLVVRFGEVNRQSIEDLRNLYIDLPNGAQIPIKEVADIDYVSGPMQISRDNTFRRTYVGVNTRGRDLESVVRDIQTTLDRELKLPPGYHIAYGGEFENLQRAKDRLSVVVPIVLLLIFVLLYFALYSFTQSVMIYLTIPMAAIGGVFALWIRGMPFSISAGIGFIVLFGVAVLNGLVLINQFNHLRNEGITDLRERILTGTRQRIRPIVLTATTDIFGFLPMAFSTTSGAEVQRPLATVVIGGMLTATLLTLVVLPALYSVIENQRENYKSRKGLRSGTAAMATVFIAVVMMPFTVLGQSSPADSLPQLTVEEAGLRASENYPRLQIQQLQIEREKALLPSARDLGITELYTGQEEFGKGHPGIYTQIGISQRGIDLFGTRSRSVLIDKRVDYQEKAFKLNSVQVKQEAKKAWVKVYASLGRYQVYQKIDSLFNDIQRAAQLKLDVEEISPLAFSATTHQANEVKLNMDQAYHDYLNALNQFQIWIGSPDSVFTVEMIPYEEMISLTEMPDSISLTEHPIFQVATAEIEVADAEIEVNKKELWPKFQLEYRRQKVDGISGFNAFQVGVEVPLLNGPQKGRRDESIVQKQIALENRAFEMKETEIQYKILVEEYAKWRDSWLYYQEQALPLAQQQRQGSTIAFQEGDIDYVTFLTHIRDAIRIEIDAWNTLENLLKVQYEIELFIHP